MKVVEKAVKSFLSSVVALSVLCAGTVFASAETDSKDKYSGTPDSVTIPALEESKKSNIYFGDVNASSSVSTIDALLIFQKAVKKITLSDTTKYAWFPSTGSFKTVKNRSTSVAV
mgnify:CR=1 FL=1